MQCIIMENTLIKLTLINNIAKDSTNVQKERLDNVNDILTKMLIVPEINGNFALVYIVYVHSVPTKLFLTPN